MQQEEFIKTIKQNEGIIYKITHMYTDGEEDKKDLYQEIVYQLWKSFASFEGKSKVSTWIYRVALNTSVTHIKKKKRQKATHLNFEFIYEESGQDKVLEEQLALLYKQINILSKIEKGIILLYLEGKSYDEIAAIIGFTTTNVATRLNRIKQKMKNNLNR